MTRRMDYVLAYDAPAEKIYQDFTSRQYWQSLMDVYRRHLPHSEVTSFSSGEGGTDIVFSQHVRRRDLPPIAKAVVPVDLIITRTQHFEPFDHEKSRADGTFAATVTHAPGHIRGEFFLSESDTGSEMRLASECKVHIPLVGGKLEELILNGLEGLFDEEQVFTSEWISRHH